MSVERRPQPQVGKERSGGGEGHAANKCQRRVDDDDRHLLMGGEFLERDPDRAVVAGDEVRKDEPAVDEEIDIGKALRRARARHIRRIG